jgi:hypothetical protein
MRMCAIVPLAGANVKDPHVATIVIGRFDGNDVIVVVIEIGLPCESSLIDSLSSPFWPGFRDGDAPADPGCSAEAETVSVPSALTCTCARVPSSLCARTMVADTDPAVTTTVAPRGTSVVNVSVACPLASSVPLSTVLPLMVAVTGVPASDCVRRALARL